MVYSDEYLLISCTASLSDIGQEPNPIPIPLGDEYVVSTMSETKHVSLTFNFFILSFLLTFPGAKQDLG